MVKIGVLASGRGSNFEAIAQNIRSGYLKNVSISVVISDNPRAAVLSRAQKYEIEALAIDPYTFLPEKLNSKITTTQEQKNISSQTDHPIELLRNKKYTRKMWNAYKDLYFSHLAQELEKREVDLVILAGFMRLVGKPLIDRFPNRIMNIHPALLPAFPGLHGQKQALDYGAKITGCTVHFVDEGLDTGPVIIQAAVPVFIDDNEETLSERILKEEHRIYTLAIRFFAQGKIHINGRKVSISNAEYSGNYLINPQ